MQDMFTVSQIKTTGVFEVSYSIEVSYLEKETIAKVNIWSVSEESRAARSSQFQCIGWLLDIFSLVRSKVREIDLINPEYEQEALENIAQLSSTQAAALLSLETIKERFEYVWAIINDESAYYFLYKQKHFTWNGIRQPNRNLLLWRDESVDGLKTGHTEAAGYCMVTSALRDGHRLITAVFGSTSMKNRANDAEKLLSYGFRFFDSQTYVKAAQVLSNPMLWKGEDRTLPVGSLDDIALTLPKDRNRKVDVRVNIDHPLVAPIAMGTVVGSLDLYDCDKKLVTRPLIALEEAPAGGWWKRTWDSLRLFFLNMFATEDATGA